MTIWVCRSDGSVQCSSKPGETLDEARADLVKRIGEANVLRGEPRVRRIFLPQLCGLPTAKVNAFEITDEGATTLFRGIVGPGGWMRWQEHWDIDPGFSPGRKAEEDGPETPFPWTREEAPDPDRPFPHATRLAGLLSIADKPNTVRELIGHRLRVIHPGDGVTMDFIPTRVNLIVDDHGVIQDIGFY